MRESKYLHLSSKVNKLKLFEGTFVILCSRPNRSYVFLNMRTSTPHGAILFPNRQWQYHNRSPWTSVLEIGDENNTGNSGKNPRWKVKHKMIVVAHQTRYMTGEPLSKPNLSIRLWYKFDTHFIISRERKLNVWITISLLSGQTQRSQRA